MLLPENAVSKEKLNALAICADYTRPDEINLELPLDHRPYTDKYFLRSSEVLKAEGLNPWVRAQVFIRQGPGEVRGVNEAVEILSKYNDFRKNGGQVLGLPEGSPYQSAETLMLIEGRAQDLVELETMYLGVLAAETTKHNDGVISVDLSEVERRAAVISKMIAPRPLIYMGARHWRFDEDRRIAAAAFAGGATETSTDIGAATAGKAGIGTIPHFLENIYAAHLGRKRAVVESTLAFDRVIDPKVPRVALVDYNNREVDDSLATAAALGERLAAVRLDTCGENLAQGAFAALEDVPAGHALLPAAGRVPRGDLRYWFGNGVTVSAALAVREALDKAGFEKVAIILSSGFGDPAKVRAFVNAERELGIRLFDSIGAGGLYQPCRIATMDLVAVGPDRQSLERPECAVSKSGRPCRPINGTKALFLGR